MSEQQKGTRVTKISIPNPKADVSDNHDSNGMAMLAIREISKLIEDHKSIISINMEIEHADRPEEDCPNVSTAGVEQEYTYEFAIQESEIQFREMIGIGRYVDETKHNRMADMFTKRMREITNLDADKGTMDESIKNGLKDYTVMAAGKALEVLFYRATMDEFEEFLESLEM